MVSNLTRCAWVTDDQHYIHYHDHEWGIPLYDEVPLFAMLMLEGMQAGLSWFTILKRRENYQKIFADFEPSVIARFTDKRLEKILQNPDIIRNRLKVYAWRQNAKTWVSLKKDGINMVDYLWQFVNNQPLINHWRTLSEVPAQDAHSQRMSKQLKKDGFTFVGPTICYAFMQATGMINDHLTSCHRYGL